MKMKTLLKTATLATLLLGSLPANMVSAQEEKVEIEFMYAFGGNIEEANLATVEAFNASQDEIEVVANYQGSYQDLAATVLQGFASGSAPDVWVGNDAMMQRYYDDGMVEVLDPLVERDAEEINFDDFIPGLMGNSYADGELIAIPYFKSTPLLYVNKSLLDEAGIELSQLETWDGLADAIRAVDNGEDINGISMQLYAWIYQAFIEQAGGSMMNEDETEYTFNTQAGVDAVDFLRDLYNEGVWKVPVGSEASNTSFNDFANGNSGFHFSSTADLTSHLEAAEAGGFELEAVMLPKNVEQSVNTGGAQLVMAAGLSEEERDAAWEFIKFATDTEQNLTASQTTGYLPVRYSTIESEGYQTMVEEQPLYQVALDQLEFAGPSPQEPHYEEVKTIWQEEVERLLNDPSIPTQEALDSAVERSNALLD